MSAKTNLPLCLLAGLLLAACSAAPATETPALTEDPAATAVQIPATEISLELPTQAAAETQPANNAYPWPQGSSACVLQAEQIGEVYARPSRDAQIFGELNPGFSSPVVARTESGWVGFDPGIAQAANVGVFRMRWAHFDDVSLSGDCLSVTQLNWIPRPQQCYVMPMEPVTLHTNPGTNASVRGTLEMGQFAGVLGLTSTGWAQLDLSDGNTPLTGIAWMEQSALNMNGTTCDELPPVHP
ncbi:MAG: hypothetical protein KIS80_03525 [Anaerolineales bacterium]|nr:hypothetical protein [Anaerolineales bacterium]